MQELEKIIETMKKEAEFDHYISKTSIGKLNKEIERMIRRAKQEERQFILNILDGIDIADKKMNNKNGGTQAIRLALKSRII